MASAIGPPPLLASSACRLNVGRQAPGGVPGACATGETRVTGDVSPEVRGRSPNNAVPTRTTVAPAAIAASKSPLMPAESSTASGWSARTRAARGGQPLEGGAGLLPPRGDRHEAAQPQTGAPGDGVGEGGHVGGVGAPAGGRTGGGPAEIDLH